MFIDIVVANGNEEEFAKMAERLGISGLAFYYEDGRAIPKIKTSRNNCLNNIFNETLEDFYFHLIPVCRSK